MATERIAQEDLSLYADGKLTPENVVTGMLEIA